jgi:Tfp pilus assembly protein PilF
MSLLKPGWLLVFVVPLIAAEAANPCVACHPKEVAAYEKTGMGRSIQRVQRQPNGRFMHAVSGSEFQVTSTPKGMEHTLEREGVTGKFNVEYVIGSGNHAFGYLVNVKNYLFQSPISYYSKRRVWDMAPGFEGDRSPDFTRPVTSECLWCHAGKPVPVAKTLNKYAQPPFEQTAISCDRCHGAATEHLRRPSAKNIVNPKHLATRARDSVCEQCHLSGEVRIPNPGKQIGDFKPGEDLETYFSVYVFEKPSDSGLKVISHVQQLARSACQIKSAGKLWCGTCHNPHEAPADRVAFYREKCQQCHATLAASHPKPAADCVSCHMPSRPARDGGHTAFTDHQIQRVAQPGDTVSRSQLKLVPWKDPRPEHANRNLALAYVTVGERDRLAALMDQAQPLLARAKADHPKDGAVSTSLGLLALRQRRTAEAVVLFEDALQAEPEYPPYLVNLATALKEAGQIDAAVAALQRAIELDPSLETAYRRLGEIMGQLRKPDLMRAVFERYLEFMPNNVNARIALERP